jgi:hypothetical protein
LWRTLQKGSCTSMFHSVLSQLLKPSMHCSLLCAKEAKN